MKSVSKPVSKSFKAALERMPSNLGWVIVRIPLDVPKVWGTRGMLKVKGESTASPFRTSLFPTGKVTTTCSSTSACRPAPPLAPVSSAIRLEPRHGKTRRHRLPRNFSASSTKTVRSAVGSTSSAIHRKWITDRVVQVKSAGGSRAPR